MEIGRIGCGGKALQDLESDGQLAALRVQLALFQGTLEISNEEFV